MKIMARKPKVAEEPSLSLFVSPNICPSYFYLSLHVSDNADRLTMARILKRTKAVFLAAFSIRNWSSRGGEVESRILIEEDSY